MNPEARPFAVRMQSFPFQTCPANGFDPCLAGLFSKVFLNLGRSPGALRQRERGLPAV